MTSQKSILVVDDDVQMLAVVRESLAALLGCSVDTTPDPEYAFELILKKPYDLLIFDYAMQPLDGALLYRLVNKVFLTLFPEDRNPPPLLLLTAHGAEDGARELLRRAGVRGLLPKPFAIERLIESVSDALRI